MSGKKVLIDGHRGNLDFVPENTMDSFRSAVGLGVDAVETDIHLSSDNALVLIHDHTVDRTTDGTGLVREKTFEELEALNAGEAALYRVKTALGSKAGKALDRETRTKIKEAERTLERVLKHKKADKLTPVDVNAINTAREALSAVAAPLVARWESEKA